MKWIALLAFSIPSFGANRSWIVQANPADLNGILARHRLALHNVIRNGVYSVLSSPTESGPDLTLDMAKDPAVQTFEADGEVDTTEAQSAPRVKPSLTPLGNAFSDHSMVGYFGSTVRGAYVNQLASSMVEIGPALAQSGSAGTLVAVIDTGIDPTHPAFRNVLVPGYDFTRGQPGYASEWADLSQSTVAILDQSTVAILDGGVPVVLNQSTVAILDQSTVAILDTAGIPSYFGHGTMVAGLIHLVTPGARIMPLKAFHADGTSNLSDILSAIYYAVDHEAKVINMSFSTPSNSPGLAAAITYATTHGVVCVASAGNNGKEEYTVYPAAYSGVIGVGSVNFSDVRSPFSNYDSRSARTSAPGEALITVYPGGHYAGVWGTSFSSALVSGAAALLVQIRPGITPSQASSAINHGKAIQQDMGNSRLDVLSSLTYALTSPLKTDN
ncbi:MAG: S8 family serine peptidase [Acidobacteriota bacterium]|nr:S8 family serine peptidase [Acidobacteriota bacterium]